MNGTSVTHTTIQLLRQLEAYIQEEIGAQSRMLGSLEDQALALKINAPERMLAATQALESEIAATQSRSRRRNELLAGLAQSWEVAPEALTLSSVVRRAGEEGTRLARQRGELERLAQRTSTLARRNGTAARFHERLTQDVVRALLALEDGVCVEDGGRLVNAEV